MVKAITQNQLQRIVPPLLVKAFGLSILFHVTLFGGLEVVKRLGWFQSDALSRLIAEAPEPEETLELEFQINLAPEPQPHIFVDADSSQATEEAPEDSEYYSHINAIGGNPDTSKDLDQPEIDGTQDKVFKTMDTLQFQEIPLQPAAEDTPMNEEEAPDESDPEIDIADAQAEDDSPEFMEVEPEAPSGQEKGDLAIAKPVENPYPGPSTFNPAPQASRPPTKRPRTLAEVKPQQSALIGEKMRQDGGVKSFQMDATPSLIGTPFGEYDRAVIRAIQKRWYDLLGETPSARRSSGRVVLKFTMWSNGRITTMREQENTAGFIPGLLCQNAVKDPAPYRDWPNDMKRLIGSNTREVRFTFYYN